MRIAAIYLPAFPLQAHVRREPSLAGEPFAVASAGASPTIIAASRAARDLGVAVGDPAGSAAARVRVVRVSPSAYAGAIEALADALMALSPRVELGDDGAGAAPRPNKTVFVELPRGARGATFGDKLLAAVNRQGLRARVGIADDRFTAWAAAAVIQRDAGQLAGAESGPFQQSITTVPRGGAAAFLAPLPLHLLPMDDEVRHLLTTLKVRTVGDFAALPPPSSLRRYNAAGVDVHRLARGEGPAYVAAYEPSGPIREQLELARALSQTEPLLFALRPLCDRVAERLRGRGRAAAALALTLVVDGHRIAVPVPLAAATTGRALLDGARAALRNVDAIAVTGVELEVISDAEPETDELDLFAARAPRRTRGRRGKRDRPRITRQPELPLTGPR